MGVIAPPRHLAIVLSEFRRLDEPFDEAWTAAMRSLPRNYPEIELFRASLEFSRPFWQASYLNDPIPVLSEAEREASERRCLQIQAIGLREERVGLEVAA